jgi:hypothetical protein
LYNRLIKIRGAIATANLNNTITIDNTKMTIQDWLVWKREVADKQHRLFNKVHTSTKSLMDTAAAQPKAYKDADGNPKFSNLLANLDYGKYLKSDEHVVSMLEQLDGQLSLKNATITIEV